MGEVREESRPLRLPAVDLAVWAGVAAASAWGLGLDYLGFAMGLGLVTWATLRYGGRGRPRILVWGPATAALWVALAFVATVPSGRRPYGLSDAAVGALVVLASVLSLGALFIPLFDDQ